MYFQCSHTQTKNQKWDHRQSPDAHKLHILVFLKFNKELVKIIRKFHRHIFKCSSTFFENKKNHQTNYIVLMGWSLLPNALRPFKIYCAPPNCGITRTWISRLNFAQRTNFFMLEVLKRAWNFRLGTPSLKSLSENLCSGFLRPEKIHRLQPGFNPRTTSRD